MSKHLFAILEFWAIDGWRCKYCVIFPSTARFFWRREARCDFFKTLVCVVVRDRARCYDMRFKPHDSGVTRGYARFHMMCRCTLYVMGQFNFHCLIVLSLNSVISSSPVPEECRHALYNFIKWIHQETLQELGSPTGVYWLQSNHFTSRLK